MHRAALSGFAAGTAMMIGGALGAVSNTDPRPIIDANAGIMNPMIAGQAMLPDRSVMDNIAASPEHGQLTAALRDSGIAAAMKANAQFTLFAPTDAAFKASGGPKNSLAERMGYLVVPGNYDSQALLRAIGEGGGRAKLRTLEGGILTARLNGPTNIQLMDEQGNTANIAIYDIHDKNGVTHVIDHMVQPAGSPRQLARS
jgi:uncharacterized surface protein with fasciclin (FAS1) repeats